MDKLTDPHAPASSTAGPSSTSDNLYPLSYYEMGLRESLAFWPKVENHFKHQPRVIEMIAQALEECCHHHTISLDALFVWIYCLLYFNEAMHLLNGFKTFFLSQCPDLDALEMLQHEVAICVGDCQKLKDLTARLGMPYVEEWATLQHEQRDVKFKAERNGMQDEETAGRKRDAAESFGADEEETPVVRKKTESSWTSPWKMDSLRFEPLPPNFPVSDIRNQEEAILQHHINRDMKKPFPNSITNPPSILNSNNQNPSTSHNSHATTNDNSTKQKKQAELIYLQLLVLGAQQKQRTGEYRSLMSEKGSTNDMIAGTAGVTNNKENK